MLVAVKQVRSIAEKAADPNRPPLVMGVLNVTPDSFYDGGRYAETDAAIAHGLEMARQGADLIDVGGESTRPCALPMDGPAETARVLPVVEALVHRSDKAISIDTRRAEVAEAALDAGAVVVNDVSGFTYDPAMPGLLGRRKPLAVAMHMRGTPEDMQSHTRYDSLLNDVADELWERAQPALEAGLPLENLFFDPGIGFSKTWQQNLVLLNNLDSLARLGRPILVGASRKSFIGHVLNNLDPARRLFGTAGAVAMAVAGGARILRVHDVAEMRDAILVAHAISQALPEDEAA
ncbi:MAG: dihydropteroate synthase [Deltaproteobacteria bacterium]|nr:dihydropteroate synthase [Deltaproteobacteria bacterium]